MLWHIEVLTNLALVIYLDFRPDGRKRFEAWLIARLMFDLAQLMTEREGYASVSTTIWYVGVVCGVPLLLLALHEAAPSANTWHRRILFAWVALSMGAAWIRFFPYTGRAVLLIDLGCYLAWIAEKWIRSGSLRQPNR